MKRLLDIVLSAAGLAVLAPVLFGIGLAVLISDGRPVFFRQTRVGQFGRAFRMWKFRTMVHNAERIGGPLTVGADRRITPLGRRLRATKLDELPQLWNVLRGDMSLVGPRPESPAYVDKYTIEQRGVLELKPGLTDLASIRFRRESELLGAAANPDELYVREIMPEKIRMNLEYGARATPISDLWVLAKTLSCLRG